MRPGVPRGLVLGFAAVSLALGAAGALLVLAHGARTIVAGGENTGGEASCPIVSTRFASGDPLYADWRRFPHDLAVYGPLAYVVPALCGRAMGWEGPGIWLAGRAVTALAGVALVLLQTAFLKRMRVRAWLRVLFALLLLILFRTWDVGFTFKPDLPAIALSYAGVLLAGGWKGRLRWAALPCFVAAVAYKQTALAGPAAIFVSLLLASQFRRCLSFAVSSTGAFLAYAGGMTLLTRGLFLENTVKAAGTVPYGVEFIWKTALQFLPRASPAILPGFAWAAARACRRRADAMSVYALVALALALLGAGRAGGDIDYFIEPAIASLAATARLLERGLRGAELGRPPRGRRALAAGLAALAVLVPVAPVHPAPYEQVQPLAAPMWTMKRYYEGIVSQLGTRSIFPGDLGVAVIADLPHPYSDGFMVTLLEEQGAIPAGELIANILAADYQYALLPDTSVSYRDFEFVPASVSRTLAQLFDDQRVTVLASPEGGPTFWLLPRRTPVTVSGSGP